MMKLYRIFLLVLVTLCSSCQGFVHKEHIVDKYYLIAVDSKSDMSVSYQLDNGDFIGVVNGGVYAIGFGDNYIIAKQHPLDETGRLNKEVTRYYIVPIDKNISQYKVDSNKIGPLSEEMYLQKRTELNVPNELAFSNLIEDNE